MKRVVKLHNRRGFTLVETLLATFILVVVSTMLINGFIVTMGYSYQTSVYNKSGANNYAACMDKVAGWNKTKNQTIKVDGVDPDTGDPVKNTVKGREEQAKADSSRKVLEFKAPSIWAGSLDELYVGVKEEKTLDLTVPGTVKGKEFSPKDATPENGGVDELADNRKCVFYYPERWQDASGSNLGRVAVMAVDTPSGVEYWWVVAFDADGNKLPDSTFLTYGDGDRIAYVGVEPT